MHIMLKVIANPYVFTNFSEVDPSNIAIYKGIDLLAASVKWMNSESVSNYRCDNTETISKIFCNTFENYINYNT